MVPEGWERQPLAKVAEVRTGVAKGKKGLIDPISVPYLRVANVQDGYIDTTEVKNIEIEKSQLERYSLKEGDVLMNEGGDFDKLGRGDVWDARIDPCLHQNHVFAVRVNRDVVEPYFLAALAGSNYGKTYFLGCSKRSTNLASINSTQLKELPVLIPPLCEQRKIAEILLVWDESIAATEQLLANSEQQKKALMQQLLTGKKRLPGFGPEGPGGFGHKAIPVGWQRVSIGKIAEEVADRNKEGENIPVLSCSKYDGFVDSLKYFKKKVYSDDTSNYKIIRRNEFGFPANHVEEGSIGLQLTYDKGIVSPIYVVFRVDHERVDEFFLYKILKTDHYRQVFAASTSASVDRRGSLRWKQFSTIKVSLPSLEEQRAISRVIQLAEEEENVLRLALERLRSEKKVLMQQLLTGKRRVKVDATAQATA